MPMKLGWDGGGEAPPASLGLAPLTRTGFLFSINAGFCIRKGWGHLSAPELGAPCCLPCTMGAAARTPACWGAPGVGLCSGGGRASASPPGPQSPSFPPQQRKAAPQPCSHQAAFYFLATDMTAPETALAQPPSRRVLECPPASLMLPRGESPVWCPRSGGWFGSHSQTIGDSKVQIRSQGSSQAGSPRPRAGRNHGPVQGGCPRGTGTTVPLWLEMGGSSQRVLAMSWGLPVLPQAPLLSWVAAALLVSMGRWRVGLGGTGPGPPHLPPAMILRYCRALRAASARAASREGAVPWHTVVGCVDSSTRHWYRPLRLCSAVGRSRGQGQGH